MKHQTMISILAALPLLAGCAEELVTETQEPVSPEVSYADEAETMEVYANSPVRLEAVIETPGPVECGWYVTALDADADGTPVEEKVGSTPAMTYIFPNMGEYTLRFEAWNEAGSTGRTWNVTATGIPLEVTFDVEDESISATVGDELAITATVVSGGEDGITHTWTLGDEVISSEAALSYTLREHGQFTLTYLGVNAYNVQVTRSWTLNIADLPLDVDFSVEDDITCTAGLPIRIAATIVTGSDGAEHSWTVDGTAAGTEAELKYTFESAGTHTIGYSATNTAGENVTRSWTVTVQEYVNGFVLFDFEASLPSNISASHVYLDDNPYETSLNQSAGVIRVDKSDATGGTSGYFDIKNISLTNAAEYTKVRVKVYIGSAPYYPRMQICAGSQPQLAPCSINGQAFDSRNPTTAAWDALIYTDDWNILEYDVTGGGFSNFSEISQIQPRPFVDISGAQIGGATTETNPRIVYYDDIEFLP